MTIGLYKLNSLFFLTCSLSELTIMYNSNSNDTFSNDGTLAAEILNSLSQEKKLSLCSEKSLKPDETLIVLYRLWEISVQFSEKHFEHQPELKVKPKKICFWLVRSAIKANLENDEIEILMLAKSGGIALQLCNNQRQAKVLVALSLAAIKILSPEQIDKLAPSKNDNVDDACYNFIVATFKGSLPKLRGLDSWEEESIQLSVVFQDVVDTILSLGEFLRNSGDSPDKFAHNVTTLAEGTHLVDKERFFANPLFCLGGIAVELVIKESKNQRNLGEKIGPLGLIFREIGGMGHNLNLEVLALLVQAVGYDHPFRGKEHNRLLSRILPSWSYWAHTKRLSGQPLEPLEFRWLVIILFEMTSHFPNRVKRGRDLEFLLPIFLFLRNQGVLLQIAQDIENWEPQLSGFYGTQSATEFLEKVFALYSWIGNYGLAVTGAQGSHSFYLWQAIKIRTFSGCIEAAKLLCFPGNGISFSDTNAATTLDSESTTQLTVAVLEALFKVFRQEKIIKNLGKFCKREGPIVIKEWFFIFVNSWQSIKFENEFIPVRNIPGMMEILSRLRCVIDPESLIPSNQHDRFLFSRKIESLESTVFDRAWTIFDFELKEARSLGDKLVSLGFLSLSIRSPESEDQTISGNSQRLKFSSRLLLIKLNELTFSSSTFLITLLKADRKDLAIKWLIMIKRVTEEAFRYEGPSSIWWSFTYERKFSFLRNVFHGDMLLNEEIDSLRRSGNLADSLLYQNFDLDDKVKAWIRSSSGTALDLLPRSIGMEIEDANNSNNRYHFHSYFGIKEDYLDNKKSLNLFEQKVEKRLYEGVFDKAMRHNIIKDFKFYNNSTLAMLKVDIMIEFSTLSNIKKLILIRCNGPSWHHFFEVSTPYDKLANKILSVYKPKDLPFDEIFLVQVEGKKFSSKELGQDGYLYLQSLFRHIF
jgi:hypothetical protein